MITRARDGVAPRSFCILLAATLLLASVPAFAQTPAADPCAAFTWPIINAKDALAGTIAKIGSGAASAKDFELTLQPTDQVAFPMKPERTPRKSGTSGGFVVVDPPKGTFFQVTLSDEAWVDVIQNGAIVKSAAFSGKTGCSGVRKSVRFRLPSAGPVTVQISGVEASTIRVDLRSAE